jgi:hypothetical protein
MKKLGDINNNPPYSLELDQIKTFIQTEIHQQYEANNPWKQEIFELKNENYQMKNEIKKLTKK